METFGPGRPFVVYGIVGFLYDTTLPPHSNPVAGVYFPVPSCGNVPSPSGPSLLLWSPSARAQPPNIEPNRLIPVPIWDFSLPPEQRQLPVGAGATQIDARNFGGNLTTRPAFRPFLPHRPQMPYGVGSTQLEVTGSVLAEVGPFESLRPFRQAQIHNYEPLQPTRNFSGPPGPFGANSTAAHDPDFGATLATPPDPPVPFGRSRDGT